MRRIVLTPLEGFLLGWCLCLAMVGLLKLMDEMAR
jgi:hypothetical protein